MVHNKTSEFVKAVMIHIMKEFVSTGGVWIGNSDLVTTDIH
jgi:hypothetical protein